MPENINIEFNLLLQESLDSISSIELIENDLNAQRRAICAKALVDYFKTYDFIDTIFLDYKLDDCVFEFYARIKPESNIIEKLNKNDNYLQTLVYKTRDPLLSSSLNNLYKLARLWNNSLLAFNNTNFSRYKLTRPVCFNYDIKPIEVLLKANDTYGASLLDKNILIENIKSKPSKKIKIESNTQIDSTEKQGRL